MREINIGRVLMQNRHKKGITQDELAEYIGVSKAAVSKWETASTYPDISLLPRLAAFFDISIDELMGYEPQMEKDDIRKLYKKLTRDFAEKPFDETMECCREIAKKYFSCPPLLFQIGALFVNHCTLSGTPKKTNAVLEEARRLFGRVREISDDAELSSLAVSMDALCLLQLGRAKEVLALLEPLERNRLSPEPLLASAFQMMGNTRAAKRILQAGIYHSM
ncbi:MAG: helix-turn-helix domain-containing protein, partial [Lachnospiraceae bacterium]|nr:helix-turn-helix domain-containing protein [Lachnospiraceae bacterium]